MSLLNAAVSEILLCGFRDVAQVRELLGVGQTFLKTGEAEEVEEYLCCICEYSSTFRPNKEEVDSTSRKVTEC